VFVFEFLILAIGIGPIVFGLIQEIRVTRLSGLGKPIGVKRCRNKEVSVLARTSLLLILILVACIGSGCNGITGAIEDLAEA